MDGFTLTGVQAVFKIYVTVDSPPPVVVVTGYNGIPCFGYSDGDILTTVTSSHLPNSYLWVESLQTTESAIGLVADNHTSVITDNVESIDTVYAISMNPRQLLLMPAQDKRFVKVNLLF